MRRILLLAALILLASSGHAQILSVYGTFSDVRSSNVPNGASTNPASPSYATTSFWAAGYGGGVTFGILPLGPVHIGLDIRGSSKPGTGGADTAMFGFRIGVKPPVIKIKPYIQASAAYVNPRAVIVNSAQPAGSTTHDEYVGYEILGGVDYPLMRLLDFRVIEIGGGKAYDVSGAFSDNDPSISIFTIGTGLVVHF